MSKSPWWCQDDACECIRKMPGQEIKMGESQFCLGDIGEERIRPIHGVEHNNDMHFCIRSPFRGVVMLEINEDDLFLLKRISIHGLKLKG